MLSLLPGGNEARDRATRPLTPGSSEPAVTKRAMSPNHPIHASGAAEDGADLQPPPTPVWDPESMERGIVRSLRRIIRAVALYSKELLRRRNLTTSQLATLRQLGRRGALSAGDLARGISVSQATITGIVDRLEKSGLLTRCRDSQDRRRVVIELTDAGREVVATSPPPLHERFVVRLAELPPEEREEIDRVLRRIVEMMEVEDVEAAPVLASETMLADPDVGVEL